MQPSRRLVSAGLVATAVAGRASAETPMPVVTLLGDSIVAGYGLPTEQGLAALLTTELERLGVTAKVWNAGIPGDTSAGGRGRLKSAVRKETAVCVVEFGGNDRAHGYPPSMTHDCLDGIVKDLKARNVTVILTGMTIPDRPDDPRVAEFNAIYASIAKANGVALCPDFMGGVTRDMRQGDGVHPKAEGEMVLAKKLAPFVVEALKGRS